MSSSTLDAVSNSSEPCFTNYAAFAPHPATLLQRRTAQTFAEEQYDLLYCDSGNGSELSLTSHELRSLRKDTLQTIFDEATSNPYSAITNVPRAAKSFLSAVNKQTTSRTVEALLLAPCQVKEHSALDQVEALTLESRISQEEADCKAEKFFLIETAQKVKHAVAPLIFCKNENINPLPPLTLEYMRATLEGQLDFSSEVIGHGGNGVVHKMTMNGKPYAIKLLVRPDATTTQEVKVSQSLNHPHVMTPLVAIKNALIYPLGESDLASYVEKLRAKPELTDEDARKLRQHLKDAVTGLSAFEAKNLIHGDLKLKNLLIADGKALVIDTDTAFTVDTFDRYAGTAKYASPSMAKTVFSIFDIFDTEGIKNSDKFSFGLALFDIFRKEEVETPFVSEENPNGKFSRNSRECLWARANAKSITVTELRSLLDPRLTKALDPSGILVKTMIKLLTYDTSPGPHKRESPSFTAIAPMLKTDLDRFNPDH